MKTLSNLQTTSWEETHLLGKTIAKDLYPGAVIALCGDLGSGKTTFIRGLSEGIGGIDPRTISSPTFNFLNIYPGNLSLYHFDLYRLPSPEEFFKSGFDEYFYTKGICCIEWAEKIEGHLPPSTLFIHFSYSSATERKIEIKGGSQTASKGVFP